MPADSEQSNSFGADRTNQVPTGRSNPVYMPPGEQPLSATQTPPANDSFYRPEQAALPAQYAPADQTGPLAAYQPDFIATKERVEWSASEAVTHHKTVGWYVTVAAGGVVLAGLMYLISHGDKTSTGSILVLTFVMLLYGARKPRVLNYTLDGKGLHIGSRFYEFGRFRSFSILREGVFTGVELMPLQRFMPAISVFFEPQDENRIIGMLGGHLPQEVHKQDAIDRILRNMRL